MSKTQSRHQQAWSAEDDAHLSRIFPDLETTTVAFQMGRSYHAVVVRARVLRLKKNPDLKKRRNRPGELIASAPSVAGTALEPYDGSELRPYDGRTGAMDAFDLPSRTGRYLYYRDGRVEPMPA